MRLLSLFLLFQCAIAAPLIFAVPTSEIFNAAHKQNLALAPFLLGAHSNAAGSPISTPSISDPFSFAYVRVLSADPSVDFRISSAKNTLLIWGWGESHSNELSQSTDFDARCPAGKTTLRQIGPAYGDFISSFSLENSPLQNKTIRIKDSEYFSIPFSREELDSAGISEKNATLSNLFVRISGTIYLQYEKREEKNLYECETTCSKYGCGTTCACKNEISISQPIFSRAVFGEKSFALENKPASFFVLSPILLEQLATSSKFSVASFSNRLFAFASFGISNSSHESKIRTLELLNDNEFHFAYIKGKAIPSQAENFSFSCAPNLTKMPQLSGENTTLIYTCIAKYQENSAAIGAINSSLVFYDDFADAYPFSFSSLSRNYTVQAPQASPSQNVRYFLGNQTHRPSMELTMLASHRNSDFSSFFQNSWMLVLLLLLLLSLWRFIRPS